jgi:hypothetical protein
VPHQLIGTTDRGAKKWSVGTRQSATNVATGFSSRSGRSLGDSAWAEVFAADHQCPPPASTRGSSFFETLRELAQARSLFHFQRVSKRALVDRGARRRQLPSNTNAAEVRVEDTKKMPMEKAGENEGEGAKTADKQYREAATKLAKSGEAMKKALEAEREIEQDPRPYAEAERAGRAHSAGELRMDLSSGVKKQP